MSGWGISEKATEKEIKDAIEWFSRRQSSSVYMNGTCMVNFNKPATTAITDTIEYALEQMQTEPTPINWIEAQKAYSANGRKPVVLHDGLYEVEIRRSYDKQAQRQTTRYTKLQVSRMDELREVVRCSYTQSMPLIEDDMYELLQLIDEQMKEKECHLIPDIDVDDNGIWKCSKCGNEFIFENDPTEYVKFCWNCGSKVEGES